MTDKQFQSWVRFLLAMLKEYDAEHNSEKKAERLREIMDNLQRTLED